MNIIMVDVYETFYGRIICRNDQAPNSVFLKKLIIGFTELLQKISIKFSSSSSDSIFKSITDDLSSEGAKGFGLSLLNDCLKIFLDRDKLYLRISGEYLIFGMYIELMEMKDFRDDMDFLDKAFNAYQIKPPRIFNTSIQGNMLMEVFV